MPADAESGRPCVLAVDDEPENLRLLERTLRRSYDVLAAESAEAALAVLASRPDIAVILSDYRMPGMNGAELLAESRKSHPAARRVIVTGYTDSDNVINAVNAGQIHYLVKKPIERTVLESSVAELVAAYRRECDLVASLDQLSAVNSALAAKEAALTEALDDQGHDLLVAQSEFERISRDLEGLASRCALTGLYNHRTFQERLREELSRARRYGKPLALMIADVNDFAQLNARIGFRAGDAVLRRLAEAFVAGDSRVRESDVVARYAGDQFAFLLPETSKDGAVTKADRLRAALEQLELPGTTTLSVSFGISGFPDDAATAEELVTCAERAQLAARSSGRNAVRVHASASGGGIVLPGETIADVRVDRFSSYHSRLFELVTTLRRDRSLACLFVDLSRLRFLERELGIAPHAEILARAGDVLDELKGDRLRREDLICRTEDADGYLCFLAASRDGAAQPDLESIAARVESVLETQLAKALRPVSRELPRVAVGFSRVLDSPITRPERLIVRLVAESRQSAHLLGERALQQHKTLLQELILRERLTPVYQPIVQLASGDIFGYESLTRGPKDSTLESPAALFGVADEVDLTFELDRACFKNALIGAANLEPVHRLFVNLLPASFYDRGLIEHEAIELLRRSSLTPSNLVFEITERLAIENFASFRQALAVYTAMGFGVAIDDVGTRHSNLESVMALRPHFIKLSDVLTRGVATSTVKREMVRSLQRIADAIDAVMVAEGIETLQDLEVLHDLGVRYGQGYYLARPGAAFPLLTDEVRADVLAIARRGGRKIEVTRRAIDDDAEDGHDSPDGPTVSLGRLSAARLGGVVSGVIDEPTRPRTRPAASNPPGESAPHDCPVGLEVAWRPLDDELGDSGTPLLAGLRRKRRPTNHADGWEEETTSGGGATS